MKRSPVVGIVVTALILTACGGPPTSGTLVEPPPSTTTVPPTTTAAPTTTLPPTTTTSTVPPVFATVPGTAPHVLTSFNADLSIAMDLPDSTIALKGSGIYTADAFSCDWSVDILGQTSDNQVKGSPSVVWLGSQPLPAESPEAQGAQWLCPSSPLFWSGFAELPEGGEADVKNEVPSRRVDVTEQADGLPGMQFEQVTGITLDRALLWIADPGDWVAAIELVMTVGPDAATQIWGVPFDPDADARTMVYTIDVTSPDDPALEVSLPDAVDFTIGYRDVTVEGDPLALYQSGGLDRAVQTVAPTVTGSDWNGVGSSISPDGRPKIILFLAHWCPHCQSEVPIVVDWIEAGSLPDTVDIYAVTVMTGSDRPNWPPQDWLTREGWTIPTIMDDASSSAATAFGVGGVPFYAVLDGDNVVRLRVSGAIGASGLDALVDIALGG